MIDGIGWLDLSQGKLVNTGEWIGFSIPFTVFDTWRTVQMIGDSYNLFDIVNTRFTPLSKQNA